jgi:hypothetical protein
VAVRDYIAKYVADLTGYRLEPAIRETEQLERATDSAADEAVRDWRKISDAAADAARKIDRSTGPGGIAGDMRDLQADAADTGREVGQEFASNLGESLASGDASRIVQDSAGGLISSLAFAGPIGAAVAAAGTIGLAFWNNFEQTTRERREAVIATASTVFQGILDEGAAFAKRFATDTLRDFLDPAQVDELSGRARKASERLGDDLAAAIVGGPDTIDAKLDEVRDRLRELEDKPSRLNLVEAGDLRVIEEYLSRISEGYGEAKGAAETYYRYLLSPEVRNAVRAGARDAGQIPYASGGRS